MHIIFLLKEPCEVHKYVDIAFATLLDCCFTIAFATVDTAGNT